MMVNLKSPKVHSVLVIDDAIGNKSIANGRIVDDLITQLEDKNIRVTRSMSFDDALIVINSDASLCCMLINWTSGNNDDSSHKQAIEVLEQARLRNSIIPIFLTANYPCAHTLSLKAMSLVNEFIWMAQDTPQFIAERVEALIVEYEEQLLPPFTKALFKYVQDNPEYSWAAPGHQGGIAFTKSAVGRIFIDFFGENLFRTDFGIERSSLGSLLDHTGPIKESEAYVAKVFGSHMSYSVFNGTSGSNRAVMTGVIGDKKIALCDRNCHKSIEQGLMMTGGLPVFFVPTRNRYGIIGPIPKSQFKAASIKKKIEQHPLKALASSAKPVYAVVTNCTYDGMCYNARQVQELLSESVDNIHFDEAWYAYARFNPLYRDRFAMRGDPCQHDPKGPTVFATHSTHKLLAALSQASYIHIRNGNKPVEHSRFNESYMLQATTSPLYAIISSNEIGAAMMDGGQGHYLTQEVINEAVDFRIAMARAHDEFAQKGEWFFAPWNALEITDARTGKKVPFSKASREQLTTDPSCWVLKSGEKWHGFEQVEDDWCMLDPIKVGIMVPGMGDDSNLLAHGIPAAVVTAYLGHKGIIPSRTTDFMVLCLFSIGVTKGKWGTLINVLLEFKNHYDKNSPIHTCLPVLAKNYFEQYGNMGLKDLCDKMFFSMKNSQMDKMQSAAFGNLPKPITLPRHAFQEHMTGKCDLVPVDKLAGRVSAVGVIPYPPGVPVVMLGESFGAKDGPWLRYITSIVQWGEKFPGFEKILEGAEMIGGKYYIWVLSE